MDNEIKKDQKKYRLGMLAAIGCSVIWGFLPIYWKLLIPIESDVIIFYRIVLVGIVCFLVGLKVCGLEQIKAPLRIKGNKFKFFLAGVLITANWSIYIWAVNAGFVIQTCIGYYIEPLVVCAFGIVLFKEKLTKHKVTALVLAVVAIIVLLIHFGEFPSIALGLASTFGCYAAIKKAFHLPAILSLLYETMFLVPPALIVVIYLEITGQGALGVGQPYQYVLLLLCGIMTATPLSMFAAAANRIPLVSLGITEYISPSIALLIGIFLFKEGFDKVQFIAFAIIWVGLVFFTLGEVRESRGSKRLSEIKESENEGQ